MVTQRKSPSGARESNAGDDFHVLWATNRVLALLDPRTDLRRVTIEGVHPGDAAAGHEHLLLGVDVAEYYGGDTFESAKSVVISQLKYSTRHPKSEWTVARLCASSGGASVIQRLAEAFRACSSPPAGASVGKMRVRLVSNQPAALGLLAALERARIPTGPASSPRVEKDVTKLRAASGLGHGQFADFARVIDVTGCGAGERSVQEIEALRVLSKITPDRRREYFASLYQRVLKECMPETADSRGLSRADVLATLGVSQEDLFPVPSRIECVERPIFMQVAQEVADEVIRGNRRLVLHGAAGVGKSTCLQILADVLPPAWHQVTYDCFGGGDYLNLSESRHTPRRALVQLHNEIALHYGLPPLVQPPPFDPDLWRAFKRTLAEAAQLTARAGGGLLLVIDAADNAAYAARTKQAESFLRNLWNESLPDNVALLASARTHRLSEIDAPEGAVSVEVRGLDESGSAEMLTRSFPAAEVDTCREFHSKSGGNPRVQRYALARDEDGDPPTLDEVLGLAPF